MNKRKIIRIMAVIVLIGIMFGFYYLYIRLPIINGYAAKNMCSCVFVAGREQKDIEANDLNFSLVKYASNTIDFENKNRYKFFLGHAFSNGILQ
jgi:ABC-type lipoprotein release transport system permease subunit